MLKLFSILLLLAGFAGLPAWADAEVEGEQEPHILTPRAIAELTLDELFETLPAIAETGNGERVEREILRRFSRSGSATADLLLSWAVEATEEKDYAQALDLLDQIVVLKPDFAEAWNKRATVYYLMEDFSASLADIRETLAREPRHFGALAGLGIILQSIDREEEAMQVFRRALDINPRLENVQKSLERLEREATAREI